MLTIITGIARIAPWSRIAQSRAPPSRRTRVGLSNCLCLVACTIVIRVARPETEGQLPISCRSGLIGSSLPSKIVSDPQLLPSVGRLALERLSFCAASTAQRCRSPEAVGPLSSFRYPQGQANPGTADEHQLAPPEMVHRTDGQHSEHEVNGTGDHDVEHDVADAIAGR